MDKKIKGVILDIDGTLIDSNHAHALAFIKAFEDYEFIVSYEKIRSLIGVGGKEIIFKITGLQQDSSESQDIIKKQGEYFRENYFSQLKVFPRTKDLIIQMKKEKLVLAIGSSANEKDLDLLLKKIGILELIDTVTSANDVKQAKPHPDIIFECIKKLDLLPSKVIMLGDTPYDIEAAKKAQVETVALRCGGWNDDGLTDAIAIYNDPEELLLKFDTSPFVS